MSSPGASGRAGRSTASVGYAVIAVAILALGMWGATILEGGLVSDDYLLHALLTEGADGHLTADWRGVLADFARPWVGLESDFYRPLLSVSLAIDLAIGGGSPLPLHLTNVLLHVAIATMTAVLCALLAPGRRASAALIGGALCAVHPVATEPVCWIAARNSELEVFFRTASMLTFVWFLERRTGAARVLSILAAIAAFASKESAVVLPLSLLALDVLHDPRRPWAARVKLHAPYWILVGAYFALRTAVLGHPIGAGGPSEALSGESLLANFNSKFSALVADVDGPGAWALCAALVLGGVAAARDSKARAALVVAVLWIAAHALPTWALRVGPDLAGSRLIYGALPPLAILLGVVILTPSAPRNVLRLVIGGSLVGLTLMARDRVDDYGLAWAEARAAEAGIAELAGLCGDDRPIGLCAMPVTSPGIPPNNPNAWFPIAERPTQVADLPVTSLGYLTVPVPRAEELLGDARGVRALWHAGAPLVAWRPGGFAVRRRTGEGAAPPLRSDPAEPGTFRFAAPTSPDLVETVELSGPRGLATSSGRIEWLTPVPELPEELATFAFGAGVIDGESARWSIDVSPALVLATLATLELPLLGFRIRLDDGAPDDLSASVSARVPQLPLRHEPFRGAVVDADDLESRLATPAANPEAELRLVLLGPQGALAIPCEPASAIVLPPGIRQEFEVIARLARRPRFWFWFEARTTAGRAGYARSEIDWFELPRR